ncbi:polymer-forming cytoskeletal protein [Paenibacillus solisilvae]|uniref:Polymer-forming cytoskeletal protein n=1 Tax=Paenibacillus solisilvae TaxID=2486751 RepID=A0ABW0VW36_9BACL
MEVSSLPELAITGFGRAAGGSYGNVTIDGAGKVDAELSCQSFVVNGTARVSGAIRTESFEVNGKMTGKGPLHARLVRINGQVHIEGPLSSDEIKLEGILKLDGSCDAEKFRVHGGFTIAGMLNAGIIDILLHGRGQVKEIGGEQIKVKLGESRSLASVFQWVVPVFAQHLTAETIEGDEIELEETTASVVRGNRVIIGSGCTIGRVEYQSELRVHPGAKVKERIRC